MRKLIGLLCLLSLTCSAQFVSLRNFDTNYFHTNTLPVPANQWLITLNTNNSIFGGGGSELWTNDTIGLATVIRPVDKARSLWHDQTTSNYFGIIVQNLNTNGDTFTLGGNFVDLSTNYGNRAIYYRDGAFGSVSESAGAAGGLKSGSSVGALGLSDGSANNQYGSAGTSVAQFNNQTNVGVAGSALSNGKTGAVRVGGLFQTSTNTAAAAPDPSFTESSAIIANSGNTGDWIFIGQTNGDPTVRVRPDGSILLGKMVDEDADPSDFTLSYPVYQWLSVTNGDPSSVVFQFGGADGLAYSYFSTINGHMTISPTGSAADWQLAISNTNGDYRAVNLSADVGNSYIQILSGIDTVFNASDNGDLTKIKNVSYSWPTARGGANSVLMDIDNGGDLRWTNLATIITNQINNNARIGPGTPNYIAKFSNPTNVTDSIMVNSATNQVDWRSRPSGTSYTNFMTNRFFSTYTSEANYHALDLVAAPAAANGFHELHAVNGASGQTEGNPPLKLMDSLVIEPASARSGHTAYNVYPAASDSGLLGTTSVPFNGATFGSGNLTFTANTTVKPTILQTVGNYGIDFGLNHLSFYRNTGVTTSLNLERNSGTVQWDFAGNLLGFGAGMSNTHAFLQNSGTAGIIGVGTNNSVTTPLRVGFMAQPANGTDRGGAQFVILGGAGTGTGRGGNIAFGTAMPTSTSSSVNTYRTNFFIAANPVTLTESSATTVCNISLGNGQVMGVTITATTEALDGTDMQVVTETFSIAAAQKTGAITTSVSASSPMSTLTTSGTLTTAWTATDGTGMVSIKCNAVSSLTQTTLRVLGYQIVLHTDGSSVLTPQ